MAEEARKIFSSASRLQSILTTERSWTVWLQRPSLPGALICRPVHSSSSTAFLETSPCCLVQCGWSLVADGGAVPLLSEPDLSPLSLPCCPAAPLPRCPDCLNPDVVMNHRINTANMANVVSVAPQEEPLIPFPPGHRKCNLSVSPIVHFGKALEGPNVHPSADPKPARQSDSSPITRPANPSSRSQPQSSPKKPHLSSDRRSPASHLHPRASPWRLHRCVLPSSGETKAGDLKASLPRVAADIAMVSIPCARSRSN